MVRTQHVSFIVIGGVSGKLMEARNKFNEQAQKYDEVEDRCSFVFRGKVAHTSLYTVHMFLNIK